VTLLEKLLNAVDDYNAYRTQFYFEELVRLRQEIGHTLQGKPVTLVVVTGAGANASAVGERYSYEGVSWRNSFDRCDCNGYGRVFLDCVDQDVADFVVEQMTDDNEVIEVK